jgi:hypothetical protein
VKESVRAAGLSNQRLPILQEPTGGGESFVLPTPEYGIDRGRQVLPACLAQPMMEVSDHLVVPCIPTYSGQALWNFQCDDRELGSRPSTRTISTVTSFTGSPEESAFFSTSVAIEACGAPLIPVLLGAVEAGRGGDAGEMICLLQQAEATLGVMRTVLADVYRTCSPAFFYHTLRPYLEGTAALSSAGLDDGIFFEYNGSGSYKKFRGPSNAQSSLFAFTDSIMGVQHDGNEFLDVCESPRGLWQITAYEDGHRKCGITCQAHTEDFWKKSAASQQLRRCSRSGYGTIPM